MTEQDPGQAGITSDGPKTSPLRIALASFVGTAVEWYDYFIYGMTAALAFGTLFFPEFSTATGTIAAFSTFAVGFIARPIGGIVMGHFGDRVGRKSMLVISLFTMGAATTMIGLLPTYAAIGIWAPLILVVLRFVQGLAAGGEWGGAVLVAVENAPPRRRILFGSFPQMGVAGGLIFANIVFLGITFALDDEAFLSWGWRVPFLVSGVLVAIGLFVRAALSESDEFQTIKSGPVRAPIVEALRTGYRHVLLAAGAIMGSSTVSYVFMTYMLSYATTTAGLSRATILTLTLVGAVVWMLMMPVSSLLADRIGIRPVLLGGSIALVVCAAFLMSAADTGHVSVLAAVMVVTAVFIGIVYGPIAALLAGLFDAGIRYSGISLSYQLGSLLGGGIAPTVAAALYSAYGTSLAITAYAMIASALSCVCIHAVARANRPSTPVMSDP